MAVGDDRSTNRVKEARGEPPPLRLQTLRWKRGDRADTQRARRWTRNGRLRGVRRFQSP